MGKSKDPNPTSPPTMRDIAARCGLSVSTVCGALNGDKDYNTKTRERVCRIAREMGYVKNPLVGTLMRQVRKGKIPRYRESIAFLTAFDSAEGWRSRPLLVQLYEHARKAANCNGYELENVWLKQPGIKPARLGQILKARNIRGLVVAPLPQRGVIRDFPWEQFYSIALGTSLVCPALNQAMPHSLQGSEIALKHIYDLGYRNPMMAIREKVDEKNAGLFELGWNYYYGQFYEASKNCLVYLPHVADLRHALLIEKVRKHCPDVVISFDGDIKQCLEKNGYRIPEDIGFVHMEYRNYQTAGVNQNWDRIALSCVDFLINQLQSGNGLGIPEVPVMLVSNCSWVDGPTVRRQ